MRELFNSKSTTEKDNSRTEFTPSFFNSSTTTSSRNAHYKLDTQSTLTLTFQEKPQTFIVDACAFQYEDEKIVRIYMLASLNLFFWFEELNIAIIKELYEEMTHQNQSKFM